MSPYAPSLYFNANDTVFALLLNKKMERAVIVMNTAARPTNASFAALFGSEE